MKAIADVAPHDPRLLCLSFVPPARHLSNQWRPSDGVMMDAASRDLARLWIDASVLSAAVQTAGSILIVILSRMLPVADPDSRALVAIVFVVMAAVVTAIAAAMVGFVTGHVLSRKLPRFPIRSWIAINALFGFAYGLIMWMAPRAPEANQWTIELIGWTLAYAVITNALEGSVQALVLRKAAHGVELWIGSCALAGACWLLVIPLEVYGPETGLPTELISTATIFLQVLLAGLILLPALLRLRPRGGSDIPVLFE
jgi:hypothetical protein